MRQVRLRGETLQISGRDWDWLVGEVEGNLLQRAHELHNARFYGFPEILDEGRSPVQQQVAELREVTAQADDYQMRAQLQALEVQAGRVADLNGRFVEVVARYPGLPAPRTQEERQEFTERMNEYKLPQDEAMLNQPERRSWNPVWAAQADYRELVRQSHILIGECNAINQRIYDLSIAVLGTLGPEERAVPEVRERVARLMGWAAESAVATEEFGDQRAKDLIDMAGDVEDKRDVALLHRALRYGKTGIQAAKAYLRLGRHYDDAGDARRAIGYYTRAIEACREPDAGALYRRGKLYYRQERWAESAEDLERALALGLRTPAHEWARMFLAKIKARTGSEGEPAQPE